jgi:hypothetical protein
MTTTTGEVLVMAKIPPQKVREEGPWPSLRPYLSKSKGGEFSNSISKLL